MLQETPLWKASEKEQDNSQLRAFMRYASSATGFRLPIMLLFINGR